MGLVVQTDGLTRMGEAERKSPQCHTCLQRKRGLFSLDGNGRPVCADCMGRRGAAFRGSEPDASRP